MNEQFLRKVIVDIIPRTGKTVSISGLRINFKCTKSNESTPNTANVEIFNLSKNTRNLLIAQNTILRLTLGYQGLTPSGQANNTVAGNPGIGTVFIGNITKVKHDKKKKFELAVSTRLENTDLISSVDVGDGDNQYRNAFLDKGYPAGIQLTDILTDLANSMGMDIGGLNNIPTKAFTQGYTVAGLSRDQLDTLCDSYGLEWSIQNQSVQVISKTGNMNFQVILVSDQTGLISAPNITNFGVEFNTLCDHRLIPGRQVQLVSKYLNDGHPVLYKIRKVVHRGSNWNGDYVSEVQATLGVVVP